MSHLPDIIRVHVSAGATPIPSLLVLTRIIMHELNDYWGIFGPTNGQGIVEISRDDLVRVARQTRAFNGEEFADVETQLSGLIEVRVLDEAGIQRALEAAASLPEYPYDDDYAARLKTAQAALIKLGRVLMEVEVTAQGGDCEVKAAQPI